MLQQANSLISLEKNGLGSDQEIGSETKLLIRFLFYFSGFSLNKTKQKHCPDLRASGQPQCSGPGGSQQEAGSVWTKRVSQQQHQHRQGEP